MIGMGAAIRNVTHLDLTLPPSIDDLAEREGLCELLNQLAASIPALQQLQVAGNISRDLLASFGASCSRLHILRVLDGLPSKSLVDLHLILPHLTHCALIPETSTPENDDDFPETSPCIMSLFSCTALTDVDVGPSSLSPDMWHALPPGLRRLQCSFIDKQPANLSPLTSLASLTCHCQSVNSTGPSIRHLVPILRVAPNLKAVTFLCEDSMLGDYSALWMGARCVPSTLLNLVYLDERALAGLTITSILQGAERKGINVRLWASSEVSPDLHERQDISVSEFLAQLPHLHGITGLLLSSDFPHASDHLITAQTAVGFPNLDTLEVDIPLAINSTTLAHLGPCSALQHLTFHGALVCPASLALLCARMAALKSLDMTECEGFTNAAGASLQEQLHVWGFGVTVTVV